MPKKIDEALTEVAETEVVEAKKVNESEELVEYYAPKTRELQDDIFVGLNGRTWLIQRGKHVKVPKCCYEILKNMEDMDELALQRQEEARNNK